MINVLKIVTQQCLAGRHFARLRRDVKQQFFRRKNYQKNGLRFLLERVLRAA
jgi:hypothetical protein